MGPDVEGRRPDIFTLQSRVSRVKPQPYCIPYAANGSWGSAKSGLAHPRVMQLRCQLRLLHVVRQ